MADGFTTASAATPRDVFTPTLLIAALDAARREAAQAARVPPQPVADPMDTLLEEARRAGLEEGYAAGLAAAERAQEATAARAADHALAALREASGAAQAAAREAADGLARIAVAMLDAALPGLAAQHAPDLAAAFARRIAPALESQPEARLFVPPGLAAPTLALLGASSIAVEEDPALSPGDARAEWRSGGARLDLSARRAEIRRVLEAAGLGPQE
jgi:flagellar biosynthesis/type III secretory pathway protein FliH